MSVRALTGLVVLNASVFSVGAAVFWGLRGWRSWNELFRLAGVAYLVGVAALFVVMTFELVLGLPVGGATIALTAFGVASAGICVGWRRGMPVPRFHREGVLPRLSLVGAIFAAAILVYVEAAFRVARLEPLWEWDAWRVWTLVAKQIFFSGAIDPDLPTGGYPSYPVGFPALQASAFHAMGSADVVTAHLLQWFLLVGFVAAIIGLLGPRVRQEILLPCLLLLLLAPSIVDRVDWMLADLPLDYLLAVAAVLLVRWIEERHDWQLAAATILLTGAVSTKREGLLLASCLVAAAFIASWADRRWAWPRLGVSALAALVLVLPWRISIVAQDIPDAPHSGYTGFVSDSGRLWPSIRLVVGTFFDFDLWLLVPFLVVGGIALALLAGAWKCAAFSAAFLGSSLAAGVWVMWANSGFTFTQEAGGSPVVRLAGGTVVVLGALTPVLLQRSLGFRAAAEDQRPRPHRLLALAPWVIVVAAGLAYPVSFAIRNPEGASSGNAPLFPSTSDCAQRPVDGGGVRLVFGYADSYPDAHVLLERARAAGFPGVDVEHGGCGELRVFVDRPLSTQEARALVRRATKRRLSVSLERS